MNIQFSAVKPATSFGTDSRRARQTALLLNTLERHLAEGAKVEAGGYVVTKDQGRVTGVPLKDDGFKASFQLRPTTCGSKKELLVGTGEMPKQDDPAVVVSAVFSPDGTITSLSRRRHQGKTGGIVFENTSTDCNNSKKAGTRIAERIPLTTIFAELKTKLRPNGKPSRQPQTAKPQTVS